MSEIPMPVLMLPEEIIGMKQAEYLTGRDARTVGKWCLRHAIGHQVQANSPWIISGPSLVLLMHGDLEGLQAMRTGSREDPRVRRAIDHLHLVLPRFAV
jgi:hypothetical protein